MKHLFYVISIVIGLISPSAFAAKYYFTQPMFIPSLTRFGFSSGGVAVSGLDYGNANVSTTSVPKSVTVTYNGIEPVVVPPTAISTPTNWAVQNNTCAGTTLGGSNTTCSFGVAFTPKSAGPISENLTVTLPGFATKTIPLTGTGVSPITSLNGYGSIIASPLRGGSVNDPFDDNDLTDWTAFYVSGQYIGRQFPQLTTITEVRAYANTPVTWTINANTPTGWVVLGSRTGTGEIKLTGLNVQATAVIVTNGYPWNDVWFSVGTLNIKGIQ